MKFVDEAEILVEAGKGGQWLHELSAGKIHRKRGGLTVAMAVTVAVFFWWQMSP